MQTLSGTDTYEWLGRFFVIHHADVMAGEDHVQNLEMVGPYDGERGTFLTSVYDAATGEVERSIASVDDAGVWSFRAGEGASRGQSTLRVDEDGQHMHGAWSRTEDGGATWWPWRRFDPSHAHPRRRSAVERGARRPTTDVYRKPEPLRERRSSGPRRA